MPFAKTPNAVSDNPWIFFDTIQACQGRESSFLMPWQQEALQVLHCKNEGILGF